MGSPQAFVFFDLGETLVDLGVLVACLGRRLRTEYRGIAADADDTALLWIRRTSESLPRVEGLAFAREIDVAASVLHALLRAKSVAVTVEQAEQILRRSWDDFERRVKFCPGVSKAWLKEIGTLVAGLGIVTDGDSINVDRLIDRLGLMRYFDAIVTSEAVRAYKPNRQIYEAALKALGAEPSHSLFVSDTVLDLRGAVAVGMHTAFLPRRLLSGSVGLPADTFRLTRPGELIELVRSFSSTFPS